MVYNRLDQTLQLKPNNTVINTITIYSIIGQNVIKENMVPTTVTSFDVSMLQEGVYVVIIETNEGSDFQRFVKM
jgi:hypothetical protein